MGRCIFLILAFIAFITSIGIAFYQNWETILGAEDFGLRIETEEEQKVLACGKILIQGVTVRSEPKILPDNIIGTLNRGDLVKIYQPVKGDIVYWTESLLGWTNDIWYKILYTPTQKEGFIYSSLLREKNRTFCLN